MDPLGKNFSPHTAPKYIFEKLKNAARPSHTRPQKPHSPDRKGKEITLDILTHGQSLSQALQIYSLSYEKTRETGHRGGEGHMYGAA